MSMRKNKLPKQKRFKNIIDKIDRFLSNPTVKIGIVVVIVLVVIVYIIFKSEKGTNSRINSLFDAIWYTIVTLTTVGYGDITPNSVLGRVSAMFLLIVGVAIFGILSGKFASFIFDRQQKKGRGLIIMGKMKNHFLICGWKAGFDKILEGILAANPEIPAERVVVVNNAERIEIESLQANEKFKGVNFLYGDFTDEEILMKAQIKNAERVIILADKSKQYSSLETDSRTVLGVITIKNLNPKIYCVAEIIDSKFEKHLSLARCDEIILTSDYEQSLLVQASSGKGMSHILRELVSEEDSSVLILQDIPLEFVGKEYGVFRSSLRTRDILIGILENTGNFYVRRNEALAEAQKNPDMEKIVSNLKKVKTLKSNIPVFNPSDDYIVPDSSKAIFIRGRTEEAV
ncbi:MAG: NAD-binding protein [Treponemataceae bacterium]|nr:NAD-binding protein [Treponemataceae bacterium]